ncbi:MaoC family dehydratase [Novosphingobium pentaromativorans]|uniref:3-alpha,7-alpha, 12-alpha-trihydroxy-5-beta-cholest-24-enoyl-CoAhydratase n=1 Tax=Novosphingobium pentaromativorans US6-1 TaxID=1088721 RepID=G6ED69_9SPHN|nr:MaoC family dehydratase [Novosphingobium pentaromativorans]AIT79837.1 3-alpha,7-alpha,12-alpha-trihydroxy-5-beta-cholest-24-enoyl-CoA hydratase [Novosphingobium pentaromativorans US6-1]EHJ60781.1 3-alpha,7-alpha,12-alpha-trihydroxy-5-beta-cholest-24-enoyl-CoAhydratase [Novosphingobium pentaromativorans US6-1]
MQFDPARLLSLAPRVTKHAYSKRSTMLYALGVGAGQDPEAGDLRFVYEEGLEALPSMAVVLGYPGFWQKEPEYGIDWKRVLHAEQSVRFYRPLPVEGEVRSEMTIESIFDKGAEKGALLSSLRKIFDAANGDLLASVTQTSFLRGNGGHGGSEGEPPRPHAVPERAPDISVTVQTRPEQALIYRLSGDYNPLHADPAVARDAGLPRPILHGLCTYGIGTRVIVAQLLGNDGGRLKRLDARFTAPVFPGDELVVSIWREGDGRAAYKVEVPARSVTAINNGFVEFAS